MFDSNEYSRCCFQSGSGITFINPVNVNINSCDIRNNNKGLFTYSFYYYVYYNEDYIIIDNSNIRSNLNTSEVLIHAEALLNFKLTDREHDRQCYYSIFSY